MHSSFPWQSAVILLLQSWSKTSDLTCESLPKTYTYLEAHPFFFFGFRSPFKRAALYMVKCSSSMDGGKQVIRVFLKFSKKNLPVGSNFRYQDVQTLIQPIKIQHVYTYHSFGLKWCLDSLTFLGSNLEPTPPKDLTYINYYIFSACFLIPR